MPKSIINYFYLIVRLLRLKHCCGYDKGYFPEVLNHDFPMVGWVVKAYVEEAIHPQNALVGEVRFVAVEN